MAFNKSRWDVLTTEDIRHSQALYFYRRIMNNLEAIKNKYNISGVEIELIKIEVEHVTQIASTGEPFYKKELE